MSSSSRVRIGSYVLLFFLAFSLGASYADDAAKIDTQPSLLRDEWYSEGWDQLFYFADGTLLVAQITVLNIGFGSHHAGVFGLLVTPDKKRTIIKQSRSNREWAFSEDQLDIQVAKNQLAGKHPGYRVQILQPRGEMDIRFETEAEPWSLGKTLEFGEDYQYVSFISPFLRADAQYRFFTEGESAPPVWQTLKDGRGFAVRYINSTGLHDLIRSSTRVVSISDAAIRPIIYTSRDQDGGEQAYLGLFKDGRLIRQAQGFTLNIETKRETADSDKRDIPRKMTVDINEDDFSLQGVIEINEFLVRIDPVDSLKPFVRIIVKLLNTPIQYRYLVSYDLHYKSEEDEVELQGDALMDHTVLRYQKRDQGSSKNAR